MFEEKQEELYLEYQRQQRMTEEEMEAFARKEKMFQEEQEEHRRFQAEERIRLEEEAKEFGYNEDFQALDGYFAGYLHESGREEQKREEKLRLEKTVLKNREREEEEAYRSRLIQIEEQEAAVWES